MYTLGIETSCDETSCAVTKNCEVISNITISSLKEHKKYGGVIPEIATRAHLKNINRVFELALKTANITKKKIDLIAVTNRPGLIGALVVGVNFAKAMSLALKKPLIGINHLHAHFFAPYLDYNNKIKFPFLSLVVSGGHTEIYQVKSFNEIKTLGKTRDDACGEVFDKIAKAYHLGYPGGPVIDKLFNDAYKKEFLFKCGKIGFDLSFSGIKTALMYKKIQMEKNGEFNLKMKIKLVSSFQYSALETIIKTTLEAVNKFKIYRVACGGGVLANQYLRERLLEIEKQTKISFLISPKKYTGDNAAMVAGLGFYLYNSLGVTHNLRMKPEAN